MLGGGGVPSCERLLPEGVRFPLFIYFQPDSPIFNDYYTVTQKKLTMVMLSLLVYSTSLRHEDGTEAMIEVKIKACGRKLGVVATI